MSHSGYDTVTPLRVAEYVVGLLDEAGRARLEREIAGDAVLARQLARWEEELMPLTEGLSQQEPSSAVWQRITHLTAPAVPAGVYHRTGRSTRAGLQRAACFGVSAAVIVLLLIVA